jgi:glycosyltransferase involved in cell wall biosynthesis
MPMYFIVGANVGDSNTTGMGRQMHGLGSALEAKGHRVDFLFRESFGSRFGRRLSRLESPFRVAERIRRLRDRSDMPPIAILHEPIAWLTALMMGRSVRTLAMVHACESRCWNVRVKARRLTGERLTLRSRVLWPLTELSQTYLSLKMCDGVLCLSTEDRDFICNHIGVSRHRVERIDNGLEPRFLGLPFRESEPDRDVLFMGSWLPRKGIRTLVAALDKLTTSGIQAKLTLAGTGVSADQIRAQLPPAWRSGTEIISHVPAERLVDLYRRHNLLVLPSVIEGIPLVVLEAMACGLTPIVSSVGGIPDVIQAGRNGVLIPPLDADALAGALMRALRDPDESRRLARRAQSDVQAYAWGRVATQVERLCEVRFA